MPYDVAIEQLPRAYAAVGRITCAATDLSRHIPALCGKAWSFIKAHNIPTDGRMIAIYRNDDPAAFRVEAGARVLAPFESTPDIACVEIPAGPAAHTLHVGPYDGLGKAHDALIAWCKTHNHPRSTVSWELYDHPTPDPAQTRTDVYHHLA